MTWFFLRRKSGAVCESPFPEWTRRSMRVALVSKAMVVGAYQRKAEEIARLGVDLTVFVPACWRDRRGRLAVEPRHTEGYRLRVLPIRWNGSYHLHHYPTLPQELQALQPDLLHMDEEPYNLATWLGIRAGLRAGAVPLFFTWQNLHRRYPPPFRWMERANYRHCPAALAGNQEAAEVLRRKGYPGQVTVIPQFGVDPNIFAPAPDGQPMAGLFRIGYAGGLILEKGVDLLLRACAGLGGSWQLSLVGSGPEEARLARLAQELGIQERVRFLGRLPSHAMPDFYRTLDVLVLPSRTRPNWKEQFGRVLVEAMACGVPVIGSDSGEIPRVIGQGAEAGGLIFPEENGEALCSRLQELAGAPDRRRELGQAGRARVLERFTMARIAQETVAVYRQLLCSGSEA